VSPKSDTNPPTIYISSPRNNTLQNGAVTLPLNVNPTTGPYVRYPAIVEIYYTTSWNQTATSISSNREHIAQFSEGTLMDATPSTFSGSLNVTGVPDGNQSITVYAEYLGNYFDPDIFYRFYITGSSTVNFMVDTTSVSVSVLSPQNQEYSSPDVPLDFAVDGEVSHLAYSLDSGANVAVQGNVVLEGLSPGAHNVTVYAWDTLGRMGVSETVVFSVSEPSQPFALMGFAAASAVAAVSILAGILLYTKRNNRKPNPPQTS